MSHHDADKFLTKLDFSIICTVLLQRLFSCFVHFQTQVSTLICDFKQLKKLPAISSRLPSIKRVIYFEDEAVDAADGGIVDRLKHWTTLSFAEVESLGRTNPADPTLPSSTDVAVVMYTSGSTGYPKVSVIQRRYYVRHRVSS